MDEAAIRERLRTLAIELDATKAIIKAHVARREELFSEEVELLSQLTKTILADAGLDEAGEALTPA